MLTGKSIEIREKMTINTKKSKSMAFYCLYCAHKELKIPTTHLEVAKSLDLPFKDINDSIKKYSHPSTGYVIPVYDLSISELLTFYGKKLHSTNQIESFNLERVKRFYHRCHKSGDFEKLFENKPHFVASSILQFYCRHVHHEEIDWYELTLISNNIRNKIVRRIDVIYSS